MKFLSLLVLSFITISAFAQRPTSLQLARGNRLNNLSLNKPIDNMPIGSVGPSGQTFLYNNGKGLDVYKSQPDNMPVLKPDGSYVDNMGVKHLPALSLLGLKGLLDANKSMQFQPDGNAKYNFLMPAYKDSLPYIDSANKLLLKPKF